MIFRVWAPRATTLNLECDGHTHELRRCSHDHWESDDLPTNHGSRYGFVVDGHGPFPDPRSPSQPDGIHGLSQVYDQAAFSWDDAGWRGAPIGGGLIYEAHIGTFTPGGTFTAAIDKLGHLRDLGVTHLEIMPVCEFSGDRGWGYDGVDVFAPHHIYGGPDGLKELVNACHRQGISVILDVVYNHLGPTGNYLERFGPYFTDRYHTPWGKAINLDGPYSDQVRRFLCDNALMWLRDYHMDGLRIDAVHAFFDHSAIPFLEQLTSEVKALERQIGRPLTLIAESDLNDPRVVRPVEAGGYGIDAQWSDDFHHALHAVLTKEETGYYEDFGSLGHLAKALEDVFVYDGVYSRFRKRMHGRRAESLDRSKFLGYIQNHDQVGNRAFGERLSQLTDHQRLKIAAALVLTSPFVPMLFQGEEWGAKTPFLYFTAHEEPGLADAVRQGRRSEFAAFGWDPERIPDPQDPETFALSKLDWGELEQDAAQDLLAWHKSLWRLRRQMQAELGERFGQAAVRYDDQAGWLIEARGPYRIICLFGDSAQELELDLNLPIDLLLTSDQNIALTGHEIRMPGASVAIVRGTPE